MVNAIESFMHIKSKVAIRNEDSFKERESKLKRNLNIL